MKFCRICDKISFSVRVSQFRNPILGQSKYGPVIHRSRTKLAIKFNCRFVPIEHRPFHAAAAAFARNFGQVYKQRATVTFSAHLWFDKQILEIQARATKPGRKIVKKDRETDRNLLLKSKQDFRRWPRTE